VPHILPLLAILALGAPPLESPPFRPAPAPPVEAPEPGVTPPWAPLYVADCADRLRALGYTPRHLTFSTWNHVRTLRRFGAPPLRCHVPQPMTLRRAPGGLPLLGHTWVNCAMAIGIARLEEVLQQVAREAFGRPADSRPVTAVTHLGTYNCRSLRSDARTSQHSFGNGLDLVGFQISGFGFVTVASHWEVRYPSLAPASRFLRTLAARLREDPVFTWVLDPTNGRGHWNHIHVDLSPLRDGAPSPAFSALGLPTPPAPVVPPNPLNQ
jgi:hypothetical protein